jgi:hypothetical protein
MFVTVVNRRDCDGVDAIRESVEVTLITRPGTVAAGEDVDGTLAAASIVDAIHESLLYQVSWTFHRPSVISGTPAATVYRGILECVVEGSGFVDIGYGARENPNSRDLGVVSNSNTAHIVLSGSDLACTPCAMCILRQNRCRQVDVVIEIIRSQCVLTKS